MCNEQYGAERLHDGSKSHHAPSYGKREKKVGNKGEKCGMRPGHASFFFFFKRAEQLNLLQNPGRIRTGVARLRSQRKKNGGGEEEGAKNKLEVK